MKRIVLNVLTGAAILTAGVIAYSGGYYRGFGAGKESMQEAARAFVSDVAAHVDRVCKEIGYVPGRPL